MECYLCGNKEFEKLEGTVRDNKDLEVLKCKNCSLVFLSSFEHICEDFYSEDGMFGGGGKCGENVDVQNWLEQTKDDDVRRYNFLKGKCKGKNVLDFGCGNAEFLRLIKPIASQVAGIELQKSMQEYYKKIGIKVYSDIDEIPKGFHPNVITMFHVLEHLKDPVEMLKKLGDKLAHAGEIIIEVPQSEDALLTLYKNKAFMDFTYWSCHLYLFNEATLRNLVARAGFKINYLKHVQRYGFANHLYWQIAKKPGGHKKLWFLNWSWLNKLYEKSLAKIGATDTIVVSISK